MTLRDGPSPTRPILVTGGTGRLGRHVVKGLQAAGRSVRVLARGQHDSGGIDVVTADLSTGQGVDAAMSGVDIVVHCAGSKSHDDVKARHLVEAASRAGVRHLVFISVIGADRIPMAGMVDRMAFGYFGSKRGAEEVIQTSGLPWTTLRATQFHDLTLSTVAPLAKLPVVPVPKGLRFQPIDTAEVADRLVSIALGEPAGYVAPIAGPKVYEMVDLVRGYLRAAGMRRPIVEVPVPGRAAAAIRAGAAIDTDHAVGARTWETFLADRVSRPRDARQPSS
jgi:uncharacterized protein YbjT (DUF2867 family)